MCFQFVKLEKCMLIMVTLDLQERMEQFEQQKERQAQMVKDIKEKEGQLTTITNEVNSKTKLLNLANQ